MSGKTRLALELARAAEPSYTGGAALVELAALADPRRVPDAVAAALDVRALPGQELVDAVVDFLAPRSLLLVVDNCEHLLAATAASRGHPPALRAAAHDPRDEPRAAARAGRGRVPGSVARHPRSRADARAERAPALRGRAAVRRAGGRRRRRASRSTTRTPSTSRASASASTACRSRSSSPPAASERSAPRRSPSASTTASACSAPRATPRRRGSTRSRRRSSGATTCSSRTSGCCSGGSRCSPAASSSRRSRPCAPAATSMARASPTCSPGSSRSRSWPPTTAPHASAATACSRPFASTRASGSTRPARPSALAERHARWALALAEKERSSPRLDREAANLRAALDTLLARAPGEALRLCVALWPFWLRRIDLHEAQRRFDEALAAAPERTALRARGAARRGGDRLSAAARSPAGMPHAEESYAVAAEIGDAHARVAGAPAAR